ncbi:MAG: hypothetical protein ACOCX9_05440 [Spirochaetota bacterium]
MEYFLYFIGFVAGVAIFLYLFSLVEDSREKLKKRGAATAGTEKNPAQQPVSDGTPARAYTFPRERICPLCGASLSKYEALYASQVKEGENKKILIYGCKYCYKPDEDSRKRKVTNITDG